MLLARLVLVVGTHQLVGHHIRAIRDGSARNHQCERPPISLVVGQLASLPMCRACFPVCRLQLQEMLKLTNAGQIKLCHEFSSLNISYILLVRCADSQRPNRKRASISRQYIKNRLQQNIVATLFCARCRPHNAPPNWIRPSLLLPTVGQTRFGSRKRASLSR